MKTKIVMLILASLFSLNIMAQKDGKNLKELKCNVNLHCESCVNKIEKNIAFEKGVKDLHADLESKTVTIKYRTDKTTSQELVKAIEELGYKCELIEDSTVE